MDARSALLPKKYSADGCGNVFEWMIRRRSLASHLPMHRNRSGAARTKAPFCAFPFYIY